tara:strand:+ start:195 stop:485 length:291 start_codon:yes stop_codon:yes gene_type:complete
MQWNLEIVYAFWELIHIGQQRVGVRTKTKLFLSGKWYLRSKKEGSDTTNHSSIQDLVISEEKWLIGSITNRSDQGTQSISFMGNLTKAYGSETHSP